MLNLLALGASTIAGAGLLYLRDIYINRDINKLKEDWNKALQECKVEGIRNHSKQTFLLIEIKRIENGFRCKSVVPQGLSVDALEKAKTVLEHNLNAKIEIKKSWDCKFINIKIINHKPLYLFKPVKCPSNLLFLGYKLDGKPFLLNIDENPHFGFCGMSGTGKSVIKSMTITNLLYNYKNDFELYLCQTVNSDDLIFQNHKSVKMTACNLNEAKVMLNKLLKIADERNEICKKANCINVNQYNKLFQDKKFKRIFLLLDEFSFLTAEDGDSDEDKRLKIELNTVFKRLAKAGRAMGICLITVVQKLSATNIDSTIRSQLSILSLTQFNSIDSNMAIGTSEAVTLEKREAIVKAQGVYETLFMPIVPGLKEEKITIQEYLHQFVPEIINPYQNSSTQNNISAKVDLFEETNKWRVPKNEQSWHLKESKVVDISKKIPEGNAKIEEEVATGRVVDINCQGKYDKQILSFIEKYGCITIKQCTQMFYNNRNESQRRLKQLEDKNILRSYMNKRIREKVYCIDKEISPHDILRADFIAKLVNEGAEVIEYSTPRLLKDLLRPDAIVKIRYRDKEYKLILEVDYTHFTNDNKLVLYEKYLNETKENFILVIMKDSLISEKIKQKKYKIKHVQFAMKYNILDQIVG